MQGEGAMLEEAMASEAGACDAAMAVRLSKEEVVPVSIMMQSLSTRLHEKGLEASWNG